MCIATKLDLELPISYRNYEEERNAALSIYKNIDCDLERDYCTSAKTVKGTLSALMPFTGGKGRGFTNNNRVRNLSHRNQVRHCVMNGEAVRRVWLRKSNARQSASQEAKKQIQGKKNQLNIGLP